MNLSENCEIDFLSERIDVYSYDRMYAIMVINGEMMVSDENHQSCLLDYFEEYPMDIGVDFTQEDDDLIVDLIKVTHGWFSNEEVDCYGFDVFGTYGDSSQPCYLIAHFPENLFACYDRMSKYAEENNYILGTFVEYNDYNVQIIDSEKNRELLQSIKFHEDREYE